MGSVTAFELAWTVDWLVVLAALPPAMSADGGATAALGLTLEPLKASTLSGQQNNSHIRLTAKKLAHHPNNLCLIIIGSNIRCPPLSLVRT